MPIDLRPDSRSLVAAGLAGLAGSALLIWIALPFLDHVPLYDELLHFLAARGIRDSGVPAIADGFYERAEWFTAIVAVAIANLGDTLVAARVPSLLASVALLMTATVWAGRRAGLLAGVTAAALLCMLPTTLDLAVFARFYTLHALLVLAMAIAAFEAAAVGRTRPQRIALGAAAAVFLGLALQFQITTLIAFAAVATGVGAILILDHWLDVSAFVRRYPLATVGGAILVVSSGLFGLYRLGFIDALREVPLWASWAADRPHYYLIEFARDLPLLWPLFPVAVFVAIAAHRRIAVFCIVVLLFALVVHSIAAAKSMRYVYYALPFFCVIWGCALSGLYAYASRFEIRLRALGARTAAPLLLLAAAVVVVLSQEGQRTARLVLARNSAAQVLYAGETDWSSAVATLAPLVASADRVVTSNSMKALYYFGRYDYELNASIVIETSTGEEFGLDERTGRRAIGTAQSIASVLEMPGTTVLILEQEKLDVAVGVPADAVAAIAARCSVLAVPAAAGVRAWQCPSVTFR